eukprot:CAMPEP_0168328846 /NCGR_PEP_ID=MMETSP0213-20121227/6755_1 /TAXON_ID=151035 /ORGANISM="Euplotes harpa, Strain FSP1.4" /LENGTH=312 /DNA_ID=CAMNT_0008332057 /DNA_START=14 /DNA_END=952 /DNA_ORIENTATION=-
MEKQQVHTDSKIFEKFKAKVNDALENHKRIMSAKHQLSKLTLITYDKSTLVDNKEKLETFDTSLKTLNNEVTSTREKLNFRLKHLLKQHRLENATMMLAIHPNLCTYDPLLTTTLLDIAWAQHNCSQLKLLLDTLVETGLLLSHPDLPSIISCLLQTKPANGHQYTQYLLQSSPCLPVEVWEGYTAFCHGSTSQHYFSALAQAENKEALALAGAKVVAGLAEGSLSLMAFVEAGWGQVVAASEVCGQRIVEEVMAKDEEGFKIAFLKMAFGKGKVPWSVFKRVKEMAKETKERLYLFVTKWFLDRYSGDDEL